jgi:hypothetical protein
MEEQIPNAKSKSEATTYLLRKSQADYPAKAAFRIVRNNTES